LLRYELSCILPSLSICADSYCILSVYKQIHSAYSQYMNRFIPHIQQICTAIFLPKIYLIPSILQMHRFILCISVYEQIHSVYSKYILKDSFCEFCSICTDSFCIFGEFVQIMSNIRNGIFFFIAVNWGTTSKTSMHVCNWTKGPQGIFNYCLCSRILTTRGMTFEFKYLGKFKLIFENKLG
jgi:hypothetical protein